MHRNSLTPAQAMWLDRRFAVNTAAYGGWTMTVTPPEPTPPAPTPTPTTTPTPTPTPPAPAPPGHSGPVNATDSQGNDLGFPKDTPVAQMTPQQSSSYWQHQSTKHEGRYKNLVGDRSFDQARSDFDELDKIRQEQQTPAEQALNTARDEGKAAGIQSERENTAKAVFRGALESQGITGEELDEIASNFTVASYIGDNGVDTTKITSFAKKFRPSGTDNSTPPDFGGGHRRESPSGTRGADGRAEAERRFGKKTS